MLDLNHPIRTVANHHPVRIVCTDRADPHFPYIGLYMTKEGFEGLLNFNHEGHLPDGHPIVENVPIPVIQFVNMYDPNDRSLFGPLHNTLEDANRLTGNNCSWKATLKITFQDKNPSTWRSSMPTLDTPRFLAAVDAAIQFFAANPDRWGKRMVFGNARNDDFEIIEDIPPTAFNAKCMCAIGAIAVQYDPERDWDHLEVYEFVDNNIHHILKDDNSSFFWAPNDLADSPAEAINTMSEKLKELQACVS